MSQALELDPVAKIVSLGDRSSPVEGDFADLLLLALKTMLPAEKVEKMMPAPTTRGYTITEIAPADFAQLQALVQQINQNLGQEVLRTASRPRPDGAAWQAKILLGEKSVVRSVALCQITQQLSN